MGKGGAKKGVSQKEKTARMLKFMRESELFFTMCELEKIGSKQLGIVEQSVKVCASVCAVLCCVYMLHAHRLYIAHRAGARGRGAGLDRQGAQGLRRAARGVNAPRPPGSMLLASCPLASPFAPA